jgi:hypothetical protein
VNSILERFHQILSEEAKQHAYFQQDNATAHTSQLSMAVLREIFELWPPCFPDLSACDFYL